MPRSGAVTAREGLDDRMSRVSPTGSMIPRSRRAGVASLGVALALAGCGFRAYSPPGGWARSEHVAPVGPGESAVTGAFHAGGGVFGPDLVGGDLGVRHGLTETLEVQGDLGYVHIDEDARSDVFRGIVMGRVGLKGRFARDLDHLSWHTAIGAGGHAGGGFISPELGLQAGYENPYITPWMRLTAFVSHPVGPREVDLARAGDESLDLDTPLVTFGLRIGTGLSFRWDDGFPARVHLALHGTQLWRVDGEDDGVINLSLGTEIRF